MYNLGIYLYLIGVAITSLFSDKVRKMWKGERNAVRVLKEKVDPKAQYVWFHAASLGEFEQGRPLMEHLRVMRCVRTMRERILFVICRLIRLPTPVVSFVPSVL